MICIFHYNNLQKYRKIKDLSEQSKNQILEAKALREKMEGENHQEMQCSSIPEIFSVSHARVLIHAIEKG